MTQQSLEYCNVLAGVVCRQGIWRRAGIPRGEGGLHGPIAPARLNRLADTVGPAFRNLKLTWLMNLSHLNPQAPWSTSSTHLTWTTDTTRARARLMRPRMHLAMRAAFRLPRPRIDLAFTATQSTAVRHSSNVSADEFVEQAVGTQQRSHKKDHETKNPSPLEIKKEPAKDPRMREPRPDLRMRRPPPPKLRRKPAEDHKTRNPSPPEIRKVQENIVFSKVTAKGDDWALFPARAPPASLPKISHSEVREVEAAPHFNITRHDQRHPAKLENYRTPAARWPEKPFAVFSRPRALNLRRLPLATTTKDIISSIDDAFRERKVNFRAARIQDIVIRPRSDNPEEVDAVVDFLHPAGTEAMHRLALQGKLKVLGVVPEVSLKDAEDLSKIPQPSEDEVIEQLSKQKPAEIFNSTEFRKVVRRTHLVYN